MTRAMLLADSILTESGTHKKSLIGIYTRIAAPRVPFRKILNVYAQFADAQGVYHCQLELVNLATGALLHGSRLGAFESRDRLTPVELIMRLPCRFENFGDYELRLSHLGHIFASRVFSVVPSPAERLSSGIESEQEA